MALRLRGAKLLSPSISFNSLTTNTAAAGDGGYSSGDDDESIIATAVSILRQQRNKTRWCSLRALYNSNGFTSSQAAEILRRIRNSPHLALRFFKFSQTLCSHDLRSFSAAAHVAARSRRRSIAISILLSAISSIDSSSNQFSLFESLVKSYREFDSAPFIFDLLIIAYIQSHKLDRALEITKLLRSRAIQPQVSTANSIIRAVSHARGSVAGLEIYRELFQQDQSKVTVSPTTSTFNALLNAIFRDGSFLSRVDEVLGEMAKFNCEFNLFTYNLLMAGFCDEGVIEKAQKIWDEMHVKGFNPDIVAFNTMIDAYSEIGEVERAEEIYRDMVMKEIEPTSNTFESLIRGHCRIGELDFALIVYRDMKRRGFAADVDTVDEVVDEMCKKGREEEGLRILREENRSDEGFSATRRTYEVLIRGFCEAGKMEVATKLQAEMAGKGFIPGLNVYEAFIMGYTKSGHLGMVERLKHEMMHMQSTV